MAQVGSAHRRQQPAREQSQQSGILPLVHPGGGEDNEPVKTGTRAEHRRFVQLLHAGLDLEAFFDGADRALGTLVAFDSSCWLSLDPSTMLPTSHFTRELGSEHLMELAANEFLEDDFNKFAALAHVSPPAATLSRATDGDPARSPRFTRVLAPHGYQAGDELRATFLDGGLVWGCVALHRRRGWFEAWEAELVADAGPYIAEGIRRAILTTARAVDGATEAPGLVLLDGDNRVESVTPVARRWLRDLFDPTAATAELPLLPVAVAEQARRASAGESEEVAGVRVPRRDGGWILVHASVLPGAPPGRVAIVLSPARQPEIATLIAEAHGLSRREREVTRLVLCGLSTHAIASELSVTAYTVQDHLKSIFTKVGVSSRRELVAHLFQQHYAPRLQQGAPIGSNGWFAEGASA
jgi:DNA-binding CsgD family transcriptional regulator